MAWPPTTHQDVQDAVTTLRSGPFGDYFRSGQYSNGHFLSTTVGGTALTAGFAYARPFMVPLVRAFDRIGINVTTAATAASGGLISCAIYNPGAGGPGALRVATAEVSSETTGGKEWTISETLGPGVYWVAVLPRVSACSVAAVQTSAHSSPFVSMTAAPPSSANASAGWVSNTAVTSFPASGSASLTDNVTMFPYVVLRAT